jgi:capsular exopolysaccharide synthesis family protein
VDAAETQTIDIGRYLRILWANAWLVVLTIAVLAGAVYYWSNGQPKVYQASSLVRVFDPSDPTVSSGGVHVDPIREVDIQVLYAQSPEVVAEFKHRMGKAAAQITSTAVSGVTTADAVTISVSSGNPKLAQSGAGTYAQVYVDRQRAALAARFGSQAATFRSQAKDLQTQIAGLDKQISDLQPTDASHVVLQGGRPIVVPESDQLRNLSSQRDALASKYADLINQAAQADVSSSNRQADIDIVQPAALPKTPASPLPLRDAAIAALAGLLVGLGLVVLRTRLRERVTTTGDLGAAAPEMPFVTAVPPNHSRFRRTRSPSLDLISSADGRLAESYRTMRAALRFSQLPEDAMVLLITSARASEGKTTTAANLAVSLAQAGEKVVVVDCDLRHSNIHELFQISNERGFSSVVTKTCSLREAVRTVNVPGGAVDVLPAGPRTTNPAELLLKSGTTEILSELKSRYRFVIVDGPPTLPVADALTLSRSVSGVLLVVRAGRTRTAALRQANQLLRQFDAPLQGAVLVGAHHENTYGGYYDYPANLGPMRKRKHVKRPTSSPPSKPALSPSLVTADHPSVNEEKQSGSEEKQSGSEETQSGSEETQSGHTDGPDKPVERQDQVRG